MNQNDLSMIFYLVLIIVGLSFLVYNTIQKDSERDTKFEIEDSEKLLLTVKGYPPGNSHYLSIRLSLYISFLVFRGEINEIIYYKDIKDVSISEKSHSLTGRRTLTIEKKGGNILSKYQVDINNIGKIKNIIEEKRMLV